MGLTHGTREPTAMRTAAEHPDWGQAEGEWLGFRAGEAGSPRGTFFADSYDAAWLYGQHYGLPVMAWTVQVGTAFVCRNQYAWLADKLGKTEDVVRAMPKPAYFLRDLDTKIARTCLRDGYDSILYTQPTTPNAQRELVALRPRNCRAIAECALDGTFPAPDVSPARPFGR